MAQTNDVALTPELIAEAVKRAMAALGQGAGLDAGPAAATRNGHLDGKRDYPLAAKRPELVKSASGLSLDEITLEKAASGKITFDDIRIRPETLEYQAQIAESVGRPHLAHNLRRAAEMTQIPDERVLEIYNSLRPYRCTKQELMDIATELESQYDAKVCAALVREAADVYEKRNRLKR
jgi:propanediol dehydratase small subunit